MSGQTDVTDFVGGPGTEPQSHPLRRDAQPPRFFVLRIWEWFEQTSMTARLSTGLILVYLVLVAVNAAAIGNLHTGDTDLLVKGARQSVGCLGVGTLVNCGHSGGSPLSQVGPYALLQYLPAMAFVKIGLTNNQAVSALGWLSLAAMAASLVVVAVLARRMRPAIWAPVMVLALIGSSLTYQSTSGFGEMLAALLVLLAVAAVIWRRPVLIVVCTALATTGKETLFPFILILGLLAGRGQDDEWLPPWRSWAPVVAGVALGEFLNVGFDVFRFGVGRNLTYLEPITRTPGLERKLNFLAAIWFAPSNGALWYWPLTVVLVLTASVVALVRFTRARRDLRSWLPSLLAVGTVVAFSVGLSDWYTPFGWIAYGPRLFVPILPGALVVILYTSGPLLATPVRWVFSRRILAIVSGAAAVAAGWAQFGAPWSWMPAVLRMESAGGGCPALTQLIIQNGTTRYYHCAQYVMWRVHPVVLKAAASEGGDVALAARVLLSVASVLLIANLTRRVRRTSQERFREERA